VSGPWERFAAGPWTQFAPAAQGRSDALAGAVGQGATFNFGDELTAAVRATVPEFSDWMMRGPAVQREGDAPVTRETSKAGSWKERYEEELSKTRGQMKADAEAYPAMTTAGNIAGNVATSALALPAAATSVGPTLVGNIAKSGALGAGLGAASGFGEGEGGAENRLTKAAISGALGAAGGAAVPVVGLAAKSAMESAPGRWLSQKVVSPTARAIASMLEGQQPARSLSAAAPDGTAGVTGPIGAFAESTANPAQGGAVERLATAMQRGKLDPSQVGRRMEQLGPEAMLADVDPQLLSAARMANTMPGETRSIAKILLEGRDRQAGPRLVSAFEGGEPPPSSYQLMQGMDANRSAVGENMYGAMRGEKLNISTDMQKLAEVPAVKEAIAAIQQDAASTGTNLTAIEIAHRVKRKLNDVAEAAFASGKPINKSDLRGVANAWEKAFWKANPTAQDADTAYRQAASLPDYMTAGRSFLSRGTSEKATDVSAPAIADLLLKADPQQTIAARAGATNAARETALEGTRPARALAQRIDQSGPVRDKLVQLYGSKQADRIMRQAEAEGVFANTSNEILRGSKTADKLAEVLDAGGTQLRASTSGVTGRVIEKLDSIVNRLAGPNEAVRNAIGRSTLNTDTQANRELLAAIAEVLAKRARGNPGQVGLASSAASNFGSSP
jgi:hypothetical protein